jgi:hypothetical protein
MAQESEAPRESVRRRLARWREFFFAQKYRFELGQSFLVVINFTLLIITASDKLQIILGIPRLRSIVILIGPFGFVGVWLFGYFMDKIVRAAQMAERQSMKRSEVWASHNDQMNRIEEEIRAIRNQVGRKRGAGGKKARRFSDGL